MGASARQFLPLNGRSTAAAGFSTPSVDPGLAPVVAIDALKITEITEGCAAGPDADGQNLDQGFAELFKSLER